MTLISQENLKLLPTKFKFKQFFFVIYFAVDVLCLKSTDGCQWSLEVNDSW